jgi:NAD(P)-dependent dehydrogenase (short-subunit alcohol dehydrogenase family)
MKAVVVTGASTGIGYATARVLSERGYRVFGGVRRDADATRLSAELGTNFTPVLFDVTDRIAVRSAADEVARALGADTLFGLVNNAGIAVPGPLLYLDLDDFRRQLEVNLTAQLAVTQAFLPLLGADRARVGAPGRIVMMSSVGGRNATPFTGPYNASKFGLEGLSESLRRELMIFGIDVVIVAPGPIDTPIWDKADALDPATFGNTPYVDALRKMKDFALEGGRKGFPPERVGEVVLTALTAARPKTRYTVTPHPYMTWLLRWLPKRWVDRAMAKRLGLGKTSGVISAEDRPRK